MSSHRRLFNHALGLLGRRKFKNISLIMVFSLLVGFFASVLFTTSSLRYESGQLLRDIPELWIQQLAGGRLTPIKMSLADSLSGLRGVRQVIPRIWGYYYDSPTGAVFTVTGNDSSLDGYGYFSGNPQPLSRGEVWLGDGFVSSHFTQTGDKISLIDNKGVLHVYMAKGHFLSPSDLITHDLIVMHPADARQLLGLLENQVTDLALRVANPLETENIGLKIRRKDPSLRVVYKQDMQRTYHALFGWRGGLFVYGGLIAMLAFLILAWDRATGLSREERREFGILKSLGWTIADVLELRLLESLVIALSAFLIGTTAAFVHIYFLDAALIKPLFIGWSVLYPAWNLTPAFTLADLVWLALITLIPYLTVTLIPAWQAAIIDPAEAMQGA